MSAAPFKVESAITAVKKTIADVDESIVRIHAPSWEARAEIARNLVTVSAAVFAGTIALGDQIVSGASPAAIRLVILSWGLELLSVCAGLYVLWEGVSLRSFYPILFNQTPEIEKALRRINPADADAYEQSIAVMQSFVAPVNNKLGQSDARARLAIRWCAILLGVALALLFPYVILKFAP